MLTIQADPTPQVTRDVQTLIADFAARHESAVMSEAYRAWYNSTPPPWRGFMGGQLGSLGPLEYLGSEQLGGKSIWGAEPIERLVYYAAPSGPGRAYLTIGITSEGKIARLDYIPR